MNFLATNNNEAKALNKKEFDFKPNIESKYQFKDLLGT